MNSRIKNAVVAILAIGATAAATSAQADIILPITGNGELALFVTNKVTGAVYVRGLGLTMNSLVAEGTGPGQVADPANGPVNLLNLSLPGGSIAADSVLSGFLTTGAVSDFTWNVIGGDLVGNNTVANPRRFALTTLTDLTSSSPTTNSAMGTLGTSMNGFLTTANNALGGANSIVSTPGQINFAELNSFFSQTPQNTVGDLGSSLNFFVVTSGGGAAASAGRVFVFNDLSLSADGTLSSVGGGTPVPVPAAVWLMGSGLMGLLGIGRRRKLVA